jgi:electron transport complex protein RnfC
LTTEFRSAKARIRELADEKARAQRAKQRFEARRQRLQEEQAQRTQELSAQKETARKVGPEDLEAIMDRVRGDRGRRGKDEDD